MKHIDLGFAFTCLLTTGLQLFISKKGYDLNKELVKDIKYYRQLINETNKNK